MSRGRCRLPAPFDRVTMTYRIDSGEVSFWYNGPADQLIASGAVEPHMIELESRGELRVDTNGNYFSRSKLPSGRFRIFRRIMSRPEHAACLPGMSLELIREESSERLMPVAPSHSPAVVLTHPKFGRPPVHQPAPRKRKGAVDFGAYRSRREFAAHRTTPGEHTMRQYEDANARAIRCKLIELVMELTESEAEQLLHFAHSMRRDRGER